MGKGVLIFVMASSLSLSAMYLAGTESDIDSAQSEAEYKEEILARETATSAYNMVVSRVKRDFDGYRGSYSDLEYGKATYDMSATEADDGSVTVVAVGKYGGKEYEIVGSVSRSGSSPLDAVTLVAPVKEVDFKKDYRISGIDAAGRANVHAVKTIWDATVDAFADEMDADQVIGVGGDGDVVKEELTIVVAALRAKIEAYEGDNKLTSVAKELNLKDLGKGKKTKKGAKGASENLGSADVPIVAYLKADTELDGDFVGYGVLFVDGDLTMKDNASWNGLVYVAGSTSVFKMEDNASVSGAVIMDGIDGAAEQEKLDENDKGLLGGHFDVDVFDEPNSSREVYHQHAYDDKYDTTELNIFAPGCKSGGMCWGQIMGPLDVDEVEIVSFNNGSTAGTYTIKEGSTIHTGNMASQLALTVDPADLKEFKLNFTSLCALAPSKPSDVQDRPEDRNSSYTIRIFDTDASGYVQGSSDVSSNSGLLYEVSIYHHAKGNDTCLNVDAVAAAALNSVKWVDPSGDLYAGEDPVCVSEDDNDYYTDAKERSKKWGSRTYQKSTKNKSAKKFWSPSGDCGNSDKGKTFKQFIMYDDASIQYNSTAIRRLKEMFAELDASSDSPLAKRLSTAARDRDMVRQLDGTMQLKSALQ